MHYLETWNRRVRNIVYSVLSTRTSASPRSFVALAILLTLLILALPAFAKAEQTTIHSHNFFDLSLREVLNIQVRASDSIHSLEIQSPLSMVSNVSMHEAGVRDLGDALSLIPEIEIKRVSNEFWQFGKKKRGRLKNKRVGLFFNRAGDSHLSFADPRALFSGPSVFSLSSIQVVRCPGARLFGAYDVVIIVRLNDKRDQPTGREAR